MKIFYISLFLFISSVQISLAQLTLTKAFNEPVVGDFDVRHGYDSTSVIPKITGANQSWDFSTLLSNNNTISSNYVTVASTPSPSVFPGATLSEDQGSNNYKHYKITAGTMEVQGTQSSFAMINYSNTSIEAIWPINFGYTNNDAFGGSTTTNSITTSIVGSIITNASGTGTVILPNGLILTNCLQITRVITSTTSSGPNLNSDVQKDYIYYHSLNKFPILTISYLAGTFGATTINNFSALLNSYFLSGLTKHEIENNLSVFPNPTKETLSISLNNNSNQNVNVRFTNTLGLIVKDENLGNETTIQKNLNVNDLSKGIYFMNVKIGQTTSTKKIIIE